MTYKDPYLELKERLLVALRAVDGVNPTMAEAIRKRLQELEQNKS